jgi:hypothetical protein
MLERSRLSSIRSNPQQTRSYTPYEVLRVPMRMRWRQKQLVNVSCMVLSNEVVLRDKAIL